MKPRHQPTTTLMLRAESMVWLGYAVYFVGQRLELQNPDTGTAEVRAVVDIRYESGTPGWGELVTGPAEERSQTPHARDPESGVAEDPSIAFWANFTGRSKSP